MIDRLKVYRAIDKLDRLGPKAVFELLTNGRMDASGDFTPGAGMGLEGARFIMMSIGVRTRVLCYRPEIGYAMVYVGE